MTTQNNKESKPLVWATVDATNGKNFQCHNLCLECLSAYEQTREMLRVIETRRCIHDHENKVETAMLYFDLVHIDKI